MVDKLGLRTWTINLRTWIFGFACLVFKTTYVDRGKPLREGAFIFTRIALFPPLDKKNVCDKAKGLCVTLERYIVGLSVRCLSTINSGRNSRQEAPYSGCFYGLVGEGGSFWEGRRWQVVGSCGLEEGLRRISG